MRVRTTNRLARTALSLTTAALVAVGVVAAPASSAEAAAAPVVQQQAETSAAQFEERILELLNADRSEQGLRPLARLEGLDDVAQDWSDKQAREGRLYHNPDFFEQYPGSPTRGGENVAYGYPTPEDMYRGWYESPGHHANMLNPDYTHIGIGIAFAADGAPYGTQNFAAY